MVFENVSESMNRRVWVFEKKKIRLKEPSVFEYSKNLKEPPGFMKEPAKTREV
jgi:hypothetical protein